MIYYVIKVLISAVLIVLVSEVAKRSSLLGGLLASLPLISMLAMIWLYVETHDSGKVAALSHSIFWLVLPSLVFFVVLPPLLKTKLAFGFSFAVAAATMTASYALLLFILKKLV